MLFKLKRYNSTHTKFQGCGHGTTANLNQVHITLIPFTIDPILGSLGYFANHLLYGTSTTSHVPTGETPATDFTSDAAYQAFVSSALTPHCAFLSHANSKYDVITPFGPTHSIHTPEQWATQIIGLNFISASAHFLLRATALTIPVPNERAWATPTPPIMDRILTRQNTVSIVDCGNVYVLSCDSQ
jgi:hypothetical protein